MTVVRNFFGVLMLAMAAYIVWPVLPHNLTQPVNKLLFNKTTIKLPFTRVKAIDIDTTLKAAKGKTVMLDFYADWCVSCKEFEQYTFSDPRVQQTLKNSVLLQVDMTEYTESDKALLKRFGLVGLPSIIFFDKESHEISRFRVTGYKNADEFTELLSKVNQS
jgi:thiol:disulfide interchange protein DsbD